MAMPQPHTEWTLDMVLALPDDGNRYELLDGELLVSPAPTWRHQTVLIRLLMLVQPYVDALGGYATLIAPATVTFTPRRQFEPDLFVVPRLPNGHMPSRFEDVGRLLLAAEVLSPATVRNDRYKKRAVYQQQGVPEYWLLDPDARLVERWRGTDSAPDILLTTLAWQPDPNYPPLLIDVESLLRDG